MARYVVIATTKVTGSGYALPDRNLTKGQVLELTAAEVTAIGAGNLRAVTATRDRRRGQPRHARRGVRRVQRDPVGGMP